MNTTNEKVASPITLEHIEVWAMESSDDERRSSIKGYFKEFVAAQDAAKGAGWYGSNGEVHRAILHTDGVNLYEVSLIGPCSDVAKEARNKLIYSIKSKLSPEEWEYLERTNNLKK